MAILAISALIIGVIIPSAAVFIIVISSD